jgi:hypothetical protein
MDSGAQMAVKVGDRVKGASSVLAYVPVAKELMPAGEVATNRGAR